MDDLKQLITDDNIDGFDKLVKGLESIQMDEFIKICKIDGNFVIWIIRLEETNSMAQYILGYMFFTGTGVNQSIDECYVRFKKSAHLGNRFAQYALGLLLLNSLNKHSEAISMFEQSAYQNLAVAQASLANIYSTNSKHINYVEALYWHVKASNNNPIYNERLNEFVRCHSDKICKMNVFKAWLSITDVRYEIEKKQKLPNDNKSNNDSVCVLCYSKADKCYIFFPCHHVMYIDDKCLDKIKNSKCMFCRKNITSVTQCYLQIIQTI